MKFTFVVESITEIRELHQMLSRMLEAENEMLVATNMNAPTKTLQSNDIVELRLPTHAHNALAINGIVLISDLIQKTDRELCMLQNVGQTTLRRVVESLSKFGLTLRSSHG